MHPRPPERPPFVREPSMLPAAEIPPSSDGRLTRQRGRRLLAIIAAVLIALGGSAGAAAFFLMRGSSEELLQLVPASSEVVATAYLDPSAGQKMNLFALWISFPLPCTCSSGPSSAS